MSDDGEDQTVNLKSRLIIFNLSIADVVVERLTVASSVYALKMLTFDRSLALMYADRGLVSPVEWPGPLGVLRRIGLRGLFRGFSLAAGSEVLSGVATKTPALVARACTGAPLSGVSGYGASYLARLAITPLKALLDVAWAHMFVVGGARYATSLQAVQA